MSTSKQLRTNALSLHVSLLFAVSIKEWELRNIPYFFESKIMKQLFVSLATAHIRDEPLRLSEFYVDVNASEVGTRKRIVECVKQGYIKIVPSSKDKRAKIIVSEPKFDELLHSYMRAAEERWLIAHQL